MEEKIGPSGADLVGIYDIDRAFRWLFWDLVVFISAKGENFPEGYLDRNERRTHSEANPVRLKGAKVTQQGHS